MIVQRVLPTTGVLSTELPDQEVVLLHTGRGEYYTLNETGGLIWQGFAQQQDVETVTQMLVARYALNPAEAKAYVVQLAEALAAEQLVTFA